MLQPLTGIDRAELIVGLHTSDDAAVYRLTPDLAVVQTVDFFTPVVDDPWTYGAIAAANSMSDIYAMGGTVLFTLNVAGFPEGFSEEIIRDVFAGGAEKVAEAGAVVAGGHTVTNDEPIYGMSVTGTVHPDRVWTKAGATPGDLLYLTKPLGTGLISTALKNGMADPAHLALATNSMLALNGPAADAARAVTVHACTDITGFGLLGHGFEMASKSDVRFEFSAPAVPVLEGAANYAKAGHIPGGLRRNQRYFVKQGVQLSASIDRAMETVLFDPQTSGGLLLSVPETDSASLESAFSSRKLPLWRVGRATEGSGVYVTD